MDVTAALEYLCQRSPVHRLLSLGSEAKEGDMKVQELLPADDGRHSVALFSFSTNSHISATSSRFSNVVDSIAIELIRGPCPPMS